MSVMAPFSRLLGPAATINELQSQLREQETMLGCEVLNIGVIETEITVKAGEIVRFIAVNVSEC